MDKIKYHKTFYKLPQYQYCDSVVGMTVIAFVELTQGDFW